MTMRVSSLEVGPCAPSRTTHNQVDQWNGKSSRNGKKTGEIGAKSWTGIGRNTGRRSNLAKHEAKLGTELGTEDRTGDGGRIQPDIDDCPDIKLDVNVRFM